MISMRRRSARRTIPRRITLACLPMSDTPPWRERFGLSRRRGQDYSGV